jgi:fatty acid elongase 3
MKTRQPLRLQGLFQLHNVILSSGSALLLALMAEELAPMWMKNGTFWVACNESSWTEVLSVFI